MVFTALEAKNTVLILAMSSRIRVSVGNGHKDEGGYGWLSLLFWLLIRLAPSGR